MTVFHDDVLLVLVRMGLVAGCGPLLRTYARVELRVAHGHLVLGHLLLSARDRILPTWNVVHVYFVYVRLILRQVLLGAGLQAIGTILLIEM